MKLASWRDGSRDGQLIVVSRDLSTAHFATDAAPTLQRALDDWNFIAPQLQDLYDALNAGRARHPFPFDPARCAAPLPRAYMRAEAAACPGQAGDAAPSRTPRSAPVLRQAGSDDLLGPTDDIVCGAEAFGIDFEAGLAAITGDVPLGSTAVEAADAIRLLMLVNGVALRELEADERAAGQGFFLSRPAAAFSPVAITPDELGAAWRDGRVHLPLTVTWNGTPAGRPQAGVDMAFGFPTLIAQLCKTRNCRAGSIVGTGPVSNRDPEAGYASIAEQRGREIAAAGSARTGFLQYGDHLRIEMLDAGGASLFGAIDQAVRGPASSPEPGPAGPRTTP
ncbi:fumarylacetoacetate hydrolase family protein [Pigmentiphaga soli]|uniref:Fumarylacetoacetate hydrolase family protein n=1 Tax=Pigmentiphaga soli TaxID=1007095 RepID=A0ABP8GHE0_9BURK